MKTLIRQKTDREVKTQHKCKKSKSKQREKETQQLENQRTQSSLNRSYNSLTSVF